MIWVGLSESARPRQADHYHAGDDREDPGRGDQVRPFAKQHDARQRGEHGAGPPADRVGDGQVTQPVAELQEQEVAGMQDAGAGQEQPVERRSDAGGSAPP